MGAYSVEIAMENWRVGWVRIEEGEGRRPHFAQVASGFDDAFGEGGFSGSEVTVEEDDVTCFPPLEEGGPELDHLLGGSGVPGFGGHAFDFTLF